MIYNTLKSRSKKITASLAAISSQYLIRSNRLKFIELVDLYKNIEGIFNPLDFDIKYKDKKDQDPDYHYFNRHKETCLEFILTHKKLLLTLATKKLLTKNDVLYLLRALLDSEEVMSLCQNPKLICYAVKNNMLSFRELVDEIKGFDKKLESLVMLLVTREPMRTLIEHRLFSHEDACYLFEIMNVDDMKLFLTNRTLLRYMLSECLIDWSVICKFNEFQKTQTFKKEYDFFSFVHEVVVEPNRRNRLNREKYLTTFGPKNRDSDKELSSKFISELSDLLKREEKLYLFNRFNFTLAQKLELSQLIENTEITKNRLIRIVDNHLESNYDFESLMSYLRKEEKKNILNI